MPEDQKPQDGAQVNPQPDKTAVDTKTSTAVDSGSVKESEAKTFDASYVKELRDEAATWRKQFRELEKRLSELDTDKQKKDEAELAENNKWKELADKRAEELAKVASERDAERAKNLRTNIGIEFKLTPSQIKRLQGSTEEELRADAQELVKDLGLDKQVSPPVEDEKKPDPIPNTQQAKKQTTAVAPDGQPQGETDEQRRARLYKHGAINSPLFQSKNV